MNLYENAGAVHQCSFSQISILILSRNELEKIN